MKAKIPHQSYSTEISGSNTNTINICDTQLNLNDYYSINSISTKTQDKMSQNDFMVLPTKYDDNHYYFAQESINFIKFCRNSSDKRIDILSDGDIQVRSLHSFDIWLPVIWIATNMLLPFAINLVSNYIYDKLKGREEDDEAQVEVTFIIKRKKEEKSLHYKGDAKAFKETFDKIDLNNL